MVDEKGDFLRINKNIMKNSDQRNFAKKRTRKTLAAAFTLALAASANAAIVDGLVENWAFDDDYSAEVDPSHAGTLVTTGTGSGSFVAGKFGSAIDLANSTDNQAFVTIGGDENDMDFTGGSMSISAWYTTESLYTNWQTLAGKGEGNGWRIARASASGTGLTFSGRRPHDFDAELDQQDGSWHHLVATVESGGDNNMYINGVLMATNSSGVLLENRGNAMQIGGNPDAGNRGWNGNIDDVAIWNRALSQSEVDSIWNGGTGASIASLSVVPEPTSLALLGFGGLALIFRKRR
ncbi:MAG: hypothetical protein ACJAVK_000035 [Akkermansiaceae bacterium]